MTTLADAIDELGRLDAGRDEQSVLRRTVEIATRSTGASRGSAVLLGPAGVTHAAHTDDPALQTPGSPDADPTVRDVVRTRCLVRRGPGTAAPDPATPRETTLGAPLVADGPLIGVLCLAAPQTGTFTDDHELVVTALARQAAWALSGLRSRRDAAVLGQRLDGTAGAAATAALRTVPDEDPLRAVDRILDVARTHLGMPLAIVSRIAGGVQRFDRMAGAAPELGFAVGQEVPLERTYCQAVLEGRIDGLIPDSAADPFAAAQARRFGRGPGAYVGVPLRMPGGAVYGSLCAVSPHAEPLVPGDLAFLRALAELVGDQLDRHERREAERRRREEMVDACFGAGALQVVLQPVVDLAGGGIAGVEALSRFPGRAGGPAEVFAAAHDTGRGVDLELVAVDAALRLLPALPPDVYLALNAAPCTLCDERLLRRLTGTPPRRVVMEITEHAAVSDHPSLLAALEHLARLGVAVAVDAAGSGFAGLQHVLALSPQLVKMDVGLVRGIDSEPGRRALARAMVLFADELGARLVAEGIETAEELGTLQELGVRYGQGFHLARPAPLEQLDLHRTYL